MRGTNTGLLGSRVHRKTTFIIQALALWGHDLLHTVRWVEVISTDLVLGPMHRFPWLLQAKESYWWPPPTLPHARGHDLKSARQRLSCATLDPRMLRMRLQVISSHIKCLVMASKTLYSKIHNTWSNMINLPRVHNALSYTIFLNCFFHGQNPAPSQVLLLEIQC